MSVTYPMPGKPQPPIPVQEIVAPTPNVQNSTIVTAKDLRSRYLFGINLTAANGEKLSDEAIQFHIDAATSSVEKYLQLDIRPRYYEQERQDYQRNQYTNWGYMRLKHGPVIKLHKFHVIYPDTGSVVELPIEWLQTDAAGDTQVVNIIPGTHSMGNFIIGYGTSILPLVFATADYLPDLFKVSYTAGFPANKCPEALVSVICKKAVIDILLLVSNSYLPNGAIEQQIGVDGVFERVTTIPFLYEKQIELYRKQYAEEISQLRSYWSGIKMEVA